MKKEKKTSTPIRIINIIILIFIFVNGIIPLFSGIFSAAVDSLSDKEKDVYSDMRIVDVTGQVWTDPALQADTPGYKTYRFDLVVENQGTQDEQVQYTPFFINSTEGTVLVQEEPETADSVRDTRMFPQGRTCIYTLYAQVQDGVKNVEIVTYRTKNSEGHSFSYTLPEAEEAEESV